MFPAASPDAFIVGLWRARRLLICPGMKLRWPARAKEMLTHALAHQAFLDFDHPDIDRVLIANAVVVREEGHWRIESGAETAEELELRADREAGICDCGSVLSNRETRYQCRSCGREYKLA